MADRIENGKVVTLRYTLKDSQGKVLDKTDEAHPFSYLHGHKNIVPGLEKELAGKVAGDKVKTVVPPEQGYGKRSSSKPQPVPRASFPPDVKLVRGARFLVEGENGRASPIYVDSVVGSTVYIDTNHPLAGKKLHFDVEIVSIREATKEELDHGHPHGPDGHEHDHE